VTHGDYCFYHRDQAMEIDVIPALTEQLTKVCINYTKVKMENPKEAKIVSQKRNCFLVPESQLHRYSLRVPSVPSVLI